MPLVEQELPTLPEHLSSSPVFSGDRVTRSLALYVYVVDRCLSFCTFSFGYCVVCSSSTFSPFVLFLITSLWYLQTLLSVPSFESLHSSLGRNINECRILGEFQVPLWKERLKAVMVNNFTGKNKTNKQSLFQIIHTHTQTRMTIRLLWVGRLLVVVRQ
jgi:hypothetical protein